MLKSTINVIHEDGTYYLKITKRFLGVEIYTLKEELLEINLDEGFSNIIIHVRAHTVKDSCRPEVLRQVINN
ncbi:hypothetical protein PQ469_05965 [Mucilaginibacter sp. KACC 22773]|uniref:hypothetical protein n=1 Tax=Mucilaginibacter sp. KACC 22773 TaxID=3025671 RepID=UPI00236521F8|nr:hypothetical protein [Mucilaginibacter sp. KACC 22773]WDF79548.1 hypothetical protein PQ469_05965 [Mucilaginibacter sp. KACC 22773]